MCQKKCGCECESHCKCSINYADTICPEGFQGSGCILYNGDILKDLAGVDYIYANSTLNTVIKQMWVKILEGGSSSNLTQLTNDVNALKTQMTTVINNIGNLSNLTTTAKENLVVAINEIDADLTALSNKIGDLSTLTTTNKTTVVAAINEVNAKVPVLGTLNNLPGVTTQATNFTDAINDRQPVWKKGDAITVGSGQTTPFNNLETAVEELKKYHFEKGVITLNLTNGTHTLTKNLVIDQSLPMLSIKSLSGNKADVTLDLNGFTFVTRELGTSAIHNLTVINPINGNYFLVHSGGSFNMYNINVNTSNFNHTVITVGGINARFIYDNLTINTTLDNTRVKRALFVANSSSIVGSNLTVNNYSTVLFCSSNSQAELSGLKFTNIYASAFVSQFNSRVMLTGDNNFDASDNPTGFENTVNYGDVGYSIAVAFINSQVSVNQLRVKNLGTISNTKRIDNNGTVLNWEASIGLSSSRDSNVNANLSHFDNFTRGISLDRNGTCTIAACKFINLNYYVYGYVGQVSHAWGNKQNGTAVMSNIVSKNPALTNSTNVGILDSPFSYSNGFITFTGWSNNAPVII